MIIANRDIALITLCTPCELQVSIYVDMKDMAALREALKGKNYEPETSLAAVPKEGTITCSDEDFQLNMDAIDKFLELDDVDSVGKC
jgi:transcriptional/translational regulatory protein YebC/TACO1